MAVNHSREDVRRSVRDTARLFDVANGSSLTLENVTLQNGLADTEAENACGKRRAVDECAVA